MIYWFIILPFFNFFISRNLSLQFVSPLLRFISYPIFSLFLLVSPVLIYGYQFNTWAEGLELIAQFPGIIIFWPIYMIYDFVYPRRMAITKNKIISRSSIKKEYLIFLILWYYFILWISVYGSMYAYCFLILIIVIFFLKHKNEIIGNFKLLYDNIRDKLN